MDQLFEQSPKLVSDIECITVDVAFRDYGDFPQADAYYQKAIEASEGDPYYHAMNLRAYGFFLFNQNRFEEARHKLQDSIAVMPPTSDPNVWFIGETHQIWGQMESEASFRPEAEKHFDSARRAFDQIKNQIQRRRAIDMLDEAEGLLSGRTLSEWIERSVQEPPETELEHRS